MPPVQPTVLQVTWNWREPGQDPGRAATNMRRLAFLQAVVMCAVAAILHFVLGHELAAKVIAGLAGVVLMLGMYLPNIYRHVHRFGQTLGQAVGTILVYLLLVPFFYLFFLPVALWLRLRGRDPLHRSFRDAKWTYWVSRQTRPRGHNIDRQFLQEDRAARHELREVGSLPRRDPEVRS